MLRARPSLAQLRYSPRQTAHSPCATRAAPRHLLFPSARFALRVCRPPVAALVPLRPQVYYADADGGSSPFSVQLDDFRMAGGTSRVCHLTQATRAIDIASLVAREEGMEQPPRLFLEGIELQPDALVCKIARPGSVVLLVPQLTELVSFFVSKVALVRPAAAPMVEAVGEVKVRSINRYPCPLAPLPPPPRPRLRLPAPACLPARHLGRQPHGVPRAT